MSRKSISMESLGYYEETPLFGDLLLGLLPAEDEEPFSFDKQSFLKESFPADNVTSVHYSAVISPEKDLPLFETDLFSHFNENPLLLELFNKISPYLPTTDLSEEDNIDAIEGFNLCPYEHDSSAMSENIISLSSNDNLSASFDSSADDVQDGDQTILSPSSFEDIESILAFSPVSSTPDMSSDIAFQGSPGETLYDNTFSGIEASTSDAWDKSYFTQHTLVGKSSHILSGHHRKDPYKGNRRKDAQPCEKKQRKKDQNKCAASRYRQKKKEQQETVGQEYERLEKTNKELHDKVDSISSEIQYLKQLMKEVLQAKRLKNTNGNVV